MARLSGNLGARRSSWFYRWELFKTPLHATALGLLVLSAFTLFALQLILVVALLAAIELVVVGLAPYSVWVRRKIDERLERDEAQRTAEQRAQRLTFLTPDHRREFELLEGAAAQVRANIGVGPHDDCSGLEELLTSYVRLALAHRSIVECSTSTPHVDALERETAALDNERVIARGCVRRALDKRYELARERLRTLRTARDERAALEHELVAIGHAIRRMVDESTIVRTASVREHAARILDHARQQIDLVSELSSLRDPDDLEPLASRVRCDVTDAGAYATSVDDRRAPSSSSGCLPVVAGEPAAAAVMFVGQSP